jgi:hypothetical protein
MRLTAPTKATFSTASLLLAIGLAARLDLVGDIDDDLSFWAVTAGGLLLWIGALFNRV